MVVAVVAVVLVVEVVVEAAVAVVATAAAAAAIAVAMLPLWATAVGDQADATMNGNIDWMGKTRLENSA